MSDARLLGKLEEFKHTTEKRLDSIESKLDLLGNWKSRVIGMAGVVTFLFSVLLTAVTSLFK